MTLNVSVGQFRQNVAEYIAKAKEGHTIVLIDEKKGQQLAQIVGTKKFDPEAFGKALKSSAGVFTAKNHPEWASKTKVSNWVHRNRLKDERTFE